MFAETLLESRSRIAGGFFGLGNVAPSNGSSLHHEARESSPPKRKYESNRRQFVDLHHFEAVAVGVEREQIKRAVGPRADGLQDLPADFGDAALEFINVVAHHREMRRGLLFPAVVRVQFVVGPQMELVGAELHPAHVRADGAQAFHAERFVEDGGNFDIGDGQ